MTLTYPAGPADPGPGESDLSDKIQYKEWTATKTCIHGLNYSDSKLRPQQYCRERKDNQVLRVPQFIILFFFFFLFKTVNAVTNATDAGTGPDTNSPTSSLPYKYGRFSFIQFPPSLKLHLLLPVTAKGYAASALEPGARGRDSGMLGLSLPRCHFLSGPPPAPLHCHHRSPPAWPGIRGSVAVGPPSAYPVPSPSGRA